MWGEQEGGGGTSTEYLCVNEKYSSQPTGSRGGAESVETENGEKRCVQSGWKGWRKV